MNPTDVRNALIQLKSEIVKLQGNCKEDNLKSLMQKYNMLFMGKHFNVINSLELLHMLNSQQGTAISVEEFNAMLPGVCNELRLETESLIRVADAGLQNPPTYCYLIHLF